MKREYLKGLGLEEDVIDKVMAEHGKGIEGIKTELSTRETELQTLQGQLETANNEIEGFKNLNVDEIKKKADEYKADYEKLQTESEEKLAKIQFDHELENAIKDSKAKNVVAVKALLDIDSLEASKDRTADIKKALEDTKEANDYLFESNQASGTGGSLGAGQKITNKITKDEILSMEDPVERKRKIAENIELFN